MGRYVHITCHLLLLFFFLFHFVVSKIPSNQRSTMINLYNLLQNNTSQSPFPWNSTRDPDPCSWRGVTCNFNNSSITYFSFQYFSLSTPDFLPVLCQIDTLESIDLSNNHLSSIPNGFMTGCGNLSGLRGLNFSRNRLSGSLPNFDGFLKLEFLDLSHNNMSGTISLQMDGLVRLKNLSLGYNQFTGPVPTHLGKSMVLGELGLSSNRFGGKIPEEITNYSNLTVIDLSGNNLSGSIPDRFKLLSNLQVLILSSNSFSGEIPQFLSSIKTLSRFAANKNSFSGAIPTGITNFLRNLDLSYNQLNGSIPSDLLSQSNLQSLDLSDNSLTGSVPENISSTLVRLRLGNNRLNGTISSSSFGSHQSLTYLELNDNSLGGSIPPELGLCKTLALLNLAMNQLTGVLPVELGNLSNLQELKLQANNLAGEIPIEITQLQGLRKLNISLNSLNSSIPSSISRLQNLNNLDLRGNKLSGSIPESIGNLNSLIELQLGSNKLGGKIPLMPQSLQIALNLSSNLFEGQIPETLSRLIGLEVLDLSNNMFTGNIPHYLVRMASLTELVLSNNLLVGLIPVFPAYISVETSGNTGLIKPKPPSPTQKKKNTLSVGLVVAVTVASSAFAISIGTIIVLSVSRRRNKNYDEQILSEEHFPQPHVIMGNYLTPNAVHRSNICGYTMDPRMSDPGPSDKSLMVLQHQHRSQAIWDADGNCPNYCATLTARQNKTILRSLGRPSDAVVELIRKAGLGGLLELPLLSLDMNLITALVERWRPETHTFHLRSGEVTLTLQDVEVLLGLPVDGRPVTGRSNLDWVEWCERLLGIAPPATQCIDGKVSFRWLRQHFTGRVAAGDSTAVVAQQARGYLLQLLGGTIFADHSGAHVNLMYLPLLEEFAVAGQYSWGSAALAVLYRNLCRSSTAASKDIGGALILLQVWAWERFPNLVAGRAARRPHPPGSPLIGMWVDDFHSPYLLTHVVAYYRHNFDQQKPEEVVWTPYSEEVLQALPSYCHAGKDIWRARVPLICFATVELHQPERVLRQFGFRQGVPPKSQCRHPLHGQTLQGEQEDWALVHAAAIAVWGDRLQEVVPPGPPDEAVYPPDDPYLVWYFSVTRHFVSRLGAATDAAIHCFERLTAPEFPAVVRSIGQQGLEFLAIQENFLCKTSPEQPVDQHQSGSQGENEGQIEPSFVPEREGPHPTDITHSICKVA